MRLKISEYLKSGDYNIIAIDWSKLAQWDNYPQAASNAILVGESVGYFLSRLIRETGLHPRDIHLVGHSLGSHVSAHIGRTIQRSGLGNVGRITALDPAKPWFDGSNRPHRISKHDADFVDVIHTNGGEVYEVITSPGLEVMGGNSHNHCCEGRGFESRTLILDGHFFTLIYCKICNVCLKKTEYKQNGPFKKRNISPTVEATEPDLLSPACSPIHHILISLALFTSCYSQKTGFRRHVCSWLRPLINGDPNKKPQYYNRIVIPRVEYNNSRVIC